MTVSIISSDTSMQQSQYPELQRYHWNLCLIKYELDIHVFLRLNCGFSAKGLAHFLLVRNNGDSIRINHLLIQKNNFIFHIFDQIKGTVKKNERGYRMKPENLRRWMIHMTSIYLQMFLSREIDIRLCQNYIYQNLI